MNLTLKQRQDLKEIFFHHLLHTGLLPASVFRCLLPLGLDHRREAATIWEDCPPLVYCKEKKEKKRKKERKKIYSSLS